MSKITGYTPAPWEHRGLLMNQVGTIVTVGEAYSGDLIDLDTARANAQLMAAAPELLEALKLAEKMLLIMKTRYAEYLRGRSYWDEGLGLDLDSAIPKARNAIAKATG